MGTNFVSYNNANSILQKIASKLSSLEGAYVLRGSVTFANLPSTLTAAMTGYVYNVSDAFTTDSRFIEGAGKYYAAGTNVAVADVSTYDAATPAGSENPSEQGWYELVGNKYVLSTDTTVDGEKTYYVKTVSIKFDVLGNFVDVSGITTRLNTLSGNLADAFVAENSYAIGDVVVHEDGLYKFKAAHTANDPWDATEVDAVTIESLIDAAEPDSLTPEQLTALLALLD